MVGLDPKIFLIPTLAAAFGEDNITVVKDAENGKSIRHWYKKWKPPLGDEPKATGDLYDRLMEKVKSEMTKETFTTVTFVWMQGEWDAKKGYGKVYATSLRGLIDQLEEDLESEDINFVIGRLGDYDIVGHRYGGHWNIVRQAQVDVAEADLRGAWVNTDDLGDDLHYTAEGYKTLGKRFAKKAIELINKHSGNKPATPLNLSVLPSP